MEMVKNKLNLNIENFGFYSNYLRNFDKMQTMFRIHSNFLKTEEQKFIKVYLQIRRMDFIKEVSDV